MNFCPFFGDTGLAKKYTPALRQNLVPARCELTAACKLDPGDTTTPEHDNATGPTRDNPGAPTARILRTW
jgi:hypothetical protein